MNTDREYCDLCGLPLRRGAVRSNVGGKPGAFCCPGCSQVFRMLMEASDAPDPEKFRETELFRKCRAMGIIPSPEELPAGERQDATPSDIIPAPKLPRFPILRQTDPTVCSPPISTSPACGARPVHGSLTRP